MTKHWLADLLGSLRYLGACATCGAQFMSVNCFVWRDARGTHCDRCAR